MKKLIAIVLMFVMVVTVFPTSTVAAEKDSIPTKVRMYGEHWNDRAIDIELADTTQTIGNVKTDSKNAYADVTAISVSVQDDEKKNEVSIGVYAKKEGTYTISFDILDADGKKVSTKKVKVYAYNDYVVKNISLEGKEKNTYFLNKKSGKVKVTLSSGNKIKKLEYGVYSTPELYYNTTRNDVIYKTFKNGSKITYGSNPDYYGYEYSNESTEFYSKNMFTSIAAPTYIRITYIDKYTKQEETTTEVFYRIIE